MVSRRFVVVGVGSLVLGLSPAWAALPPASSRFEAHSHRGTDGDYHVDMRVGRDPTVLVNLFVHSTRCSEGVNTRQVPVEADGSVSVSRRFTPSGSTATDSGEFVLTARFTSKDEAAGTFRITIPDCDSGERSFTARRIGAGGHDHGHGGAPYPDFRAASRSDRARAVRLWRATLRNAWRFDTPAELRRAGFALTDSGRRPKLLHWRKGGNSYVGPLLDARRPQSFVYWYPVTGRPVLVAFMYRAPLRPKPATLGGILDWHTHRNGKTWMTHVWLTRDRRSAFARCFPVEQLEHSLPAFDLGDRAPDTRMHNMLPCESDQAGR